MNNKIGIFDSGVGGLTVLNQLLNNFSDQVFLYYADSGRAPYGNRSKEELLLFNKQIINFLLDQKIKLLIMACNTSCALVLEEISSSVSIPIIDLINPAAKFTAKSTANKKVAVLATKQTIASGVYQKRILQIDSSINVLGLACPELVPIVENCRINEPETKVIVAKYLQQIVDFGADTIIFGCSHYPYFEPILRELDLEKQIVNYVDPAKCVVSEVGKHLTLIASGKVNQLHFWVSGNVEKFRNFISTYFAWPKYDLIPHYFNET